MPPTATPPRPPPTHRTASIGRDAAWSITNAPASGVADPALINPARLAAGTPAAARAGMIICFLHRLQPGIDGRNEARHFD
jgi:hypothetical protein